VDQETLDLVAVKVAGVGVVGALQLIPLVYYLVPCIISQLVEVGVTLYQLVGRLVVPQVLPKQVSELLV